MKEMLKKSGIAVLLVMTATAPGLAQNPEIDYLGYAWETGGFPPSYAGDVLFMTGTAGIIDPIFGVDLDTEEVTFYIYGCTSLGAVDMSGTIYVTYTGGYLEIYRDAAFNADWGTYPPNATSPSTFMDGTLLFKGVFNPSLIMYMTAAGNGGFEGSLDGIAGEFISDVCSDCAYTWGGSFTSGSGADVLDGYDLQIDGVFELDGAVANDQSTWGDVKSLYGN